MKVKVAAILEMVDQDGFISVAKIMEKFDLEAGQAWKVILVLCDKGVVMPMATSFFGRPVDGDPPSLGKTESSWYQRRGREFWEFYDKRDDLGVGIADVMSALNVSRPTAVNLLNHLVENGELISRESEFGGIFGNRPKIFGKDEGELESRELLYLDQEEQRKKKRKSRS